MQIKMDARMKQHGGIGTYICNLLPYLEVDPIGLRSPIYSLKEQIEFLWKIPSCDLFWSPHFNVPLFPIRAKKCVVTIHDLFHLDHFLSIAKRLYAKTLLKQAIQKASHIITVSEFSKSRILVHFPRTEEKITVIHPGADHLIHIDPKPIKAGAPFFLFVGNTKPHKNLSFLKNVIPNLIAVTEGSLPIEELCWLYRNAEALIFPSLYEGWGLPPLEAMSLGCPVIASKAASIPEACGDAALYFDPTSQENLKEAVNALPKKREELIAKGKIQAAKFSWKAAAEKHRLIFNNV